MRENKQERAKGGEIELVRDGRGRWKRNVERGLNDECL